MKENNMTTKPTKEEAKVISLTQAQNIIQQEKEQRGAAFIKEYQMLCAKYNCEIVQQGLTVVAK